MNCKCCGEKVDVTDNRIPPTWFGKYRTSKLLEVICAVCIKTEKGRKLWTV